MRKYILMFIICISSFMIYTNNVNAATYSATKHFTDNHIVCSAGYDYCQDDVNIFNITDAHYGTAYFSFVLPPQVIINNVSVSNEWGAYYTCDIGNTLIYSDNTNGWHVMSAICPMYITPQGLKKVRFEYDDQYLQQQGFYITMGDYWSFTTDNSALDYTTILNSINGNLTNFANTNHSDLTKVLTYQNNIYYQLVDIYSKMGDISTKLDNIKNNVSATASNTQEIKEKINDSSIDNNNATGTINNLSGQLASDNTISSLLLLPINFINVLIDGLSGECVPYSLGELWGSEIVLPCINLYNTFGAIWYMVDTGLSALVIFKMSKYFIRLFNKLTNLKDGGLEEAYS